ncbi:MAG: hypothetical protein MRK00_06955 [Nitrosomonas sp.]|nr:hypothetical protein [Nitrosomonas sp.]
MDNKFIPQVSRRKMLQLSLAAGAVGAGQALIPGWREATAAKHGGNSFRASVVRPSHGAVGFTSFIHPTAGLNVRHLSLGAASLIDAFVDLNGQSADVGNAVNLQDNCRLLNYEGVNGQGGHGNLYLGDGTFTAHGVTFVGNVHIGEACGTGINAIVQNAHIHDASFTGLAAHILGSTPHQPIEIPEASLVLFGARILSQDDVQANIMPVPAPFSLFFADVDQENLVLARGFNLLYRAAGRMIPFSNEAGNPRNPGDQFPELIEAFGKLSVAPPTIYRRGTGVIPGRQANLGDLGFGLFEPHSPVPTPSTPAPDMGGLGLNAPPSDSPESTARFVIPNVMSPELIDDGAVVLGGCKLEEGVRVGSGSYVLGDVAPTVSVGRNTVIGRNSSLHELTFTSCRVGENCVIGNRVVLHGPVEIGNAVHVGDGAVLFGPRVHDGVRIGARALVFGPVEITEDVPDDAIIVAPGNEFLIAPSAPMNRVATTKVSKEMLSYWKHAQDAGGGCGCGVGNMVNMGAWV